MKKRVSAYLEAALNGASLSVDQGLFLFKNAPLAELMEAAHLRREQLHPNKRVGWLIDRNINYTNICCSKCLFCNFYRGAHASDAYTLTIEEYIPKIEELFAAGGDQLLLQGGMHPDYGLEFYTNLFSQLKKRFPTLKLHALGPPEIVHISKKENISYSDCLKALVEAGLDSLPGAGAEILSDRVRTLISPRKATTQQWIDVMLEAHKMNLTTSATMMYGHIETDRERIEHLALIRQTQEQKPADSVGFIAFIPWPFQSKNSALIKKYGETPQLSSEEHVRMIAISRLMLNNIPHIQPSWLTIGVATGQLCLHAGADDFGSVMLEEHVVSQAGATHWLTKEQMPKAIEEAGFEPQRRNQGYNYL